MKMKYLALLAAVVVLLGAIFFIAPDAKAEATHNHTGNHCVCVGKTIESAEGTTAHASSCGDITWTGVGSADFATQVVNGGSFYLTENVTLTAALNIPAGTTVNICLNGYNITSSVANAITVGTDKSGSAAAVLNLTDCQYNGTVGGVVSTTGKGDVINTYYNGTLNVYGGFLTSAKGYGIVYVRRTGSAFNLYGGCLNAAADSAANKVAVVISNDCTFNMYGGVVDGAGYEFANALIHSYISTNPYTKSNINIHGGTIKNGNVMDSVSTNQRNDSTLVWCAGTLNITGGNLNDGNGTDVYCDNVLSISGTPVIGELYIADGTTTTIGTMAEGAKVGLKVENISAFSGATEEANVAYFASTNADYEVKYDAGKMILERKTLHNPNHCVCNGNSFESAEGNAAHDNCDDITWTGVGSADFATVVVNGGSFYLTENVTLSAVLVIPEGTTVNICLNGFNITSSAARAITVGDRSRAASPDIPATVINLTDCQYDGEVGGTVSTSGSGDLVETNYNCTFNMFGGFLASARGYGIVYVRRADGEFNLYNGTLYFQKAAAASKGAVAVGGTFNMYGGTIDGKGFGLRNALVHTYVGTDGVPSASTDINIHGGTITGGKVVPHANLAARYLADHIFSARGTLNITGGNIAAGSGDVGKSIYCEGTFTCSSSAVISGGAFIKIANDGFNFTLPVDAVVDINGMTGTITLANGVVLSILDTESNDYSDTNLGRLTVDGSATVARQCSYLTEDSGYRHYLAIQNEDGSWSAHRYYLGITYKGVNPGHKGIGVKATFAATPTLQALITEKGIMGGGSDVSFVDGLGKKIPDLTGGQFGNQAPNVYTASFIAEDAYTGESLNVTKYFRAFLTFTIGGEAVTFESNAKVDITPDAMLKEIDAKWNEESAYTDEQKQAIVDMVGAIDTTAFTALKAQLTNILPPESASAELAAIPVAKKKSGVNI